MTKRPYRAVHIHTDLKFISDTAKFEGEYFQNEIILISNSREEVNNKNINIRVFRPSPKSLRHIVRICSEAGLVVLYGLNFIKARLALALQ